MNHITRVAEPGRPRRRLAILLFAALPLAGCAAALPILAAFAGNLISTASRNYAPTYADDIKELMTSFGQLSARTAAAARSGDGAAPPLEVDATILARRTQADGRPGLPEPLDDGAVLNDRGGGQDNGADSLKIQVRTSDPCYLYVVAIDATGWAQVLFPSHHSTAHNPVAAGQEVLSPQDPNDWGWLDTNRGLEHVYFVASRQPQPDIEAALKALADYGPAPALDPESVATVSEQAVVSRGFPVERQREESTVTTEDGDSHAFDPHSYIAQLASSDVVLVTRWFHHEP